MTAQPPSAGGQGPGTTSVAAPASFRPHLTHGRSRAAIAGAFWSGVHVLAPTLSAALAFFAAAYFLTPTEFGLVGLAAGIVSVALAFSPAAFGEALVQRQTLDRCHPDSVFALSMAYGLGAAGFLVLISPLIGAMADEEELGPILQVLALRVPFDMAASVPSALIVRDMRFKAVAIRTTVATIVATALTFAMLLSGFGLWALVLSQLASSLIIAAMAFWAARWIPGRAVSWPALKELMRYGIFASGNRMLAVLRLDHILLGAMGGAAMLGLYVLANKLYRMLSDIVAGALSSVAHALLSTLQGEPEKMREAFGMVAFVAASVGFPVFAGTALIVDDLVGILLKPDWGEARLAAQVFCLAGLLATVSIVQGALLKSQGRADWWFYYQLFQTATTVLAIAVFAHVGLDAVVIAIVAKSFLTWPISVLLTTRLLGIGTGTYLRSFGAPALATAVMSAAVWHIAQQTAAQPAAQSLALQIAGGVAVYVPVLAILAWPKLTEIRHFASQGRASAS